MVVFGDQVTKILHNSLFTFLLSKARQAKMEHMEMKISQPIFGILVVWTNLGKYVMSWAMKTFDVTIDPILVHFIGSKLELYVSFQISTSLHTYLEIRILTSKQFLISVNGLASNFLRRQSAAPNQQLILGHVYW